jgi:hypothetical protein
MKAFLKRGYLACGFATVGLAIALGLFLVVFWEILPKTNASSKSVLNIILMLLGLYASSLILGAYSFSWIRKTHDAAKAGTIGVLVAFLSVATAAVLSGMSGFVLSLVKQAFPGSLAGIYFLNETSPWYAFTDFIARPTLGALVYGSPFWLGLGFMYGKMVWKRVHPQS